MKLQIALVALALVTVPFAAAGPSLSAGDTLPGEAPVTPTQYIVGFHALPADREFYLGERVVDVNEAISFFVIETMNPALFETKVGLDGNVKYYELNAEIYSISFVPNDTHYNNYQYSMKPATTNMEAAWDKTLGSTSAKVCVVDTGQYRDHQDFVGSSWYAWRDFVNGKTAAYDDNGHGTHVTGTIGARTHNANGVAGVAQASMAAAKVLNKAGSGTISNVANGITWCADVGSHIISGSLGGGASSTLANAVNYADGKGVLQVYAAGNSGPCTNCVGYPAAYTLTVAVSCTDQNNALCSFSSQGPQVDFAAPGKDIPSTYPPLNPCQRSNTNCYVLSSGTSMSAPHVSGLAALIKSVRPSSTKDSIYSDLKASARDLGTNGWDEQFGWGLIQGTAV